ncbi:MAG: PspC domain-containing protein [Verrucomicrobiota bacterium]|jgi:phage shock protein PspC (stress-responsive transcriptional regulator)
MNKVITINLGGNAYQLEEAGYDALRAYLESATSRLQGNPDRDEILADIEQAIAEKFRALLGSHKTVVQTNEVAAVLSEMGPIEGDATAEADAGKSEPKASGATGQEQYSSRARGPRRLYRIREGAKICGVCNGIAAYLNLDPTLVRLGFVLLTIFWGMGLLVYVVMAFVVPEANSPEEKAAASGDPLTAQEFIRRAKEGYYEAMKDFPDRKARREWKRRFKREMRAMGDQWRYSWHSHWAECAPAHPGMGFVLPILSLLQGMATIVGVCALISLLATGAVFGVALPANVPVWVAAFVLLIIYGIIAGPLKAARSVCYWSLRRPGWTWSTVFLVDGMIWLVIVATMLWLAMHYFPELRDAVHSIPALLHQAADDIRGWWKKN